MDNRFAYDEYKPAAAASRRPGRHPSGAAWGGGGSGPWPVPAAAPHSDSLAPPNCSGTDVCRSTTAQGSHDLREKTELNMGERF